jgi:hypothetical protein
MSDLKRRLERLEQTQHASRVLFVLVAEGETQEAAFMRAAAEWGQPMDAFSTVLVLRTVRPADPVAEVDL